MDRVVGLTNVMAVIKKANAKPVEKARLSETDGYFKIEFADKGVTIPVELTPEEWEELKAELSRDAIFRISVGGKYIIEQIVRYNIWLTADEVLKFLSENRIELADINRLMKWLKPKAGFTEFAVYWTRRYELDTTWGLVFIQNIITITYGSPYSKRAYFSDD